MVIPFILLVGILAGWLVGLILNDGGLGFVGNAVVGIVGAIFGVVLFGTSALGTLFTAVFSAIGLIFVVRRIR